MSPRSLVTPCLGPDTLASLCAACDAACESKCGDPVPWYNPGVPGGLGALRGVTHESPGPLGLGRPQEEDEERDGGKGRGSCLGTGEG